jgi:hypothetical protein
MGNQSRAMSETANEAKNANTLAREGRELSERAWVGVRTASLIE